MFFSNPSGMAVFAHYFCVYVSFLKSASFNLQFPLSSFCFIISSCFCCPSPSSLSQGQMPSFWNLFAGK